jgi:hypothetical protein
MPRPTVTRRYQFFGNAAETKPAHQHGRAVRDERDRFVRGLQHLLHV